MSESKVISLDWNTIEDIANSGYAQDYFNTGDTVNVKIGNKDYEFEIIGFNKDVLEDGSLAPISFYIKDVYGMHNFSDTTSNIGGSYTGAYWFKNCGLRDYIQNDIFALFPEELKSKIQKVKKYSFSPYIESKLGSANYPWVEETIDNLFILSGGELFGWNSEKKEPTFYDYFTEHPERLIKKYNGEVIDYWTRSTDGRQTASYQNNNVHFVNSEGKFADSNNSYPYNTEHGVTFGFCIGNTNNKKNSSDTIYSNIKIDKVTKMIEQPDVWLCHRNYDKICILSPIEDLKIYKSANSVDEISFTLHKINNGIEFEYWDKLDNLKVACVDGFGYFEIAVDKEVSDDTTKVITGISTEAELGQINVYNFEVNGENDKNNSENFDSNGNYIPTVLCNSTDTKHSLLHRLLSNAPHWKIGSVSYTITENDKDVSTSEVHRTFSFDGTNIYDALQEIAKEFDVIFVFNTVDRKINMYDLNKIGEDTTIYISTQNLANDFTCSNNKDSIKNCFKVIGGDDLINGAIRAINPNGTDYIYVFSTEQMEDMSDELSTKLQDYESLCGRLGEEYTTACEKMYDAIDKVSYLTDTMYPTRNPEPTTASDEISKLTSEELGNIPVESLTTLYKTGAEKAIKTVAQVRIDYRYEVSIEDGSEYDEDLHTWTGKFKVTNPTTNDTAISASEITLTFVEDEKNYLQDKINKLVGEIDIEDTDLETFKTNLKNYCLTYLDNFTKIYAECENILLGQGYASEKYAKEDNDFYKFYKDYHDKYIACKDEYEIRSNEVKNAEAEKKIYEKEVADYQEQMNFEEYLGEDLYKEFCLYRREDTYQNDNYISDGMDNSELFKNAKQLLEVATKELYKASTFQTVYTANLNNLFTNHIYEPFYDYFDLFNWIHAEVDGKQIMLRLIGITFNFSSIETIEVEFSEQVRNANGISDIESILNQSKSMATSYSSTVKQAANGSEANLEFNKLKQEGLNSALMNIKNSNNEEVVIDNRGINCSSRDQNDQYDQHQLRITGKNIVMTDDDWETAKMALGSGMFNGQEVYGVWCDVLVGSIVVSESMLIANQSGTFIIDKDGIIVERMKLDMSNADNSNRIVIDPNLKSIISVYSGTDQVFYVDTQGNICMLGNLYINNNGMYLRADMTSENIIEIGCGEIIDTGNEEEIEEEISAGNFMDMPWERSTEALDMVYGWNMPTSNYVQGNSLPGGSTSVTSGSSNSAKIFTQKNIMYKNGEVYFLIDRAIKKYNGTNWVTLCDFSGKISGNNMSEFVETNRNDDCLYIIVCNGNDSNSLIYISKYNISTGKFTVMHNLNVRSGHRYYYDFLCSSYLYNDILYICGRGVGSNNIYEDGYYQLESYENDEDYTGSLINKNTWSNHGHYTHNFFNYNGKIYALLADKNYLLSLYLVNDLHNRNYVGLADFCNISSCTSYYSRSDVSYTIHKDCLYVFVTMNTGKVKFYIYDFTTGKTTLNENSNNPYLDCKITGYYHNGRGIVSFSDGENLHLYNVGIKASASDKIGSSSLNSYYYTNLWKKAPTYICTLNHYIYKGENNKVSLGGNFKELDGGKNFINTLQSGYTTIGDKIYASNVLYNFFGGDSTLSNYPSFKNRICCLDTTSDTNEWTTIWEMESYNSTSSAYNNFTIVNLCQSNSTDKIYFTYVVGGNETQKLGYVDLNTNTAKYFNGTEFVDDVSAGIEVPTGGDFSYIDERTNTRYRLGNVLAKNEFYVDNTNTKIASVTPAVSNVIYLEDIMYYVGNVSSEKYALFSCDYNGNVVKLSDIFEGYSNDYGFSICLYKNRIHIYHSEKYGKLSKTRYAYGLDAKVLKSYDDVFQDNGLYTVNNSTNGYKTCFLPMYATSNGIHIFVGYPIFKPEDTVIQSNGGYKHYLYSEDIQDNSTVPTPTLPSVENPDSDNKIFYISNKGHGFFYGDVYANNGVFRGDIYARSLTLGTDAKNTMDSYLKDYVGGSTIITSDDFKYETETDENGVTKVTVTCDGVTSTTYSSDKDNYILTNVGLGDKSNTFCQISKDGLLEATNAVIYGEIHATEGVVGGWKLSNNTLYSADSTGTNVTLYSSSVADDNSSRPVLLIQKDGVNNYALYSDGYQLVRKLVVENDNGDSVVGKAYFRKSRIDFMSAGTVDLSGEFDDIDTGFTDEGTSDGSEEEGSETEEETGEGITDDPSLWSSVSLRCGFQAISDENRTSGTSMIFAGCKSNPGETIVSFDSSNFWVNAAGGLFTRQITCYNTLSMYSKDNNGKRYKKGVMWFGTTSNYYRLRVGNLSETNSYLNEIDFTKYKTSGKYYTCIQLKARRIDMSTSALISRGTAKVTGTSDEKVKDIYNYTDKYDKFFMNLKPVLYKYNFHSGDEYKRIHCGFGARAVEHAMHDAGLTNEDFGGLCIDKNVVIKPQGVEEGIKYDELYSLDYNEFISLNTYMIQKLYNKIEQLEQKLSEAGIE